MTKSTSKSQEHQQHLTPNKRKSAAPPPPPQNDDNEAKRSKLIVTPSPLQARDPTTSGSSDEVSQQLPSQIAATTKLCSMCKVSKSLDEFSKTQLQKEDDKQKCKLCIAANQPPPTAKPTVRSCQMCKVVKPLECFSKTQLKKGGKCEVCCFAQQKNISLEEAPRAFEEEQRRKQPAKEMQQEDAIRAAVEENAHEEARTIQKVKDAYEQYVTKLKASGSTIEKEMTKQTDLLYVVTSISRREGDVFGPCLHGVYTTCQKAQEAAREVFEEVSESYRDGEFVSHETRVAKCDMTNFLLPGVEGAFRPLFEVFGPDEDDEDCTAVAINVVRIGSDVEQSLPYIQDSTSAWIKSGLDADTVLQNRLLAGTPEKNLKVHALFSYKVCSSGEERDINLIGIYEDRDEAINRARAYSKDFIDDEQMEVSYNLEVTDGELIVADGALSVSLETVILDDEDRSAYGNEIEISVL